MIVLFQRSTPRWQSSTYSARSTSFIALRIGDVLVDDLAVFEDVHREVRADELVLLVAVFLVAALEAGREASAAFDETSPPNRSSDSVYQRFRYFWIVGRSTPPSARTSPFGPASSARTRA